MEDAKVAEDSARQAAQHDQVKSRVDGRVNAEIGSAVAARSTETSARVANVASAMRENAISDTERGERVRTNARTAARGSQFLDYAFMMLYTLLGIRLVLSMIGARSGNGFVAFIAALTNPFYRPFRDIVPSPAVEGGFTLVLPVVVAIVAYVILHVAINALLRMVGRRKTEI